MVTAQFLGPMNPYVKKPLRCRWAQYGRGQGRGQGFIDRGCAVCDIGGAMRAL